MDIRKARRVALLALTAVLLAACAAPGAPADPITVEDAWVRPAVEIGGNGASYMIIRNNGDRAVRLVKVEADFASSAELHESMKMPAEESSGMDLDGEVMQMRPLESIEIAAGGNATLEPGGYHIMFLDVTRMLEPGSTVILHLTFESGLALDIEAEVRES